MLDSPGHARGELIGEALRKLRKRRAASASCTSSVGEPREEGGGGGSLYFRWRMGHKAILDGESEGHPRQRPRIPEPAQSEEHEIRSPSGRCLGKRRERRVPRGGTAALVSPVFAIQPLHRSLCIWTGLRCVGRDEDSIDPCQCRIGSVIQRCDARRTQKHNCRPACLKGRMQARCDVS